MRSSPSASTESSPHCSFHFPFLVFWGGVERAPRVQDGRTAGRVSDVQSGDRWRRRHPPARAPHPPAAYLAHVAAHPPRAHGDASR